MSRGQKPPKMPVLYGQKINVFKLYSAVVKAKLADVFKEADANNDGKLTYDEWESRMGKLMPADELKSLLQECDTDKNGSLDTEEFATGMAGKYEIQWAQVSS